MACTHRVYMYNNSMAYGTLIVIERFLCLSCVHSALCYAVVWFLVFVFYLYLLTLEVPRGPSAVGARPRLALPQPLELASLDYSGELNQLFIAGEVAEGAGRNSWEERFPPSGPQPAAGNEKLGPSAVGVRVLDRYGV